jgi:flavin reductase (DIM6/NTAB) family NADH-FMN oxidoreductase RutF
VDEAAKKAVLRLFSYGLFAVTANDGAVESGMTANWLTQVSFEPPLVAVAVEQDARTLQLIRASRHFAVNVLASGQRELAGLLGRRSRNVPDKLQQTAYRRGETGAPLLEAALGYVECRLEDEVPAGDHVLLIGEVIAAGLREAGEPLTLRETGFRYAG